MAISPQISSIKASGTYRFEFDKSQVVSIPANQIRLVIGFSRTGPFNTPVFVPDSGFFKQVYGDIDRNLERKDSYFHRSCLAALERGPILALNLLALDSEDEVQYRQFSTAATTFNANNNVAELDEYSGFYNKDKFWFPDSETFLSLVGATDAFSPSTTNNILDFVNLGQNPVSVIVRKAAAANVSGFNVTVEEWYGSANVPGFLDKDSLISDFMVDIFFIQGNFGGDFGQANPYERFLADPTYQEYFVSNRGIKRKRSITDTTDTYLEEFFNESEVNLFAQYTACLIPDFIDQLGNNLFVETLVNADSASTGMFCAVNQDLFSGDFLIDGRSGGIDLIGHNIELAQPDKVNFLSYEGPISADFEECNDVSFANNAQVPSAALINVTQLTTGEFELIYQGSVGDAFYDALAELLPNTATVVGSFVKSKAVVPEYVPVTGVQVALTTVTVTFSGVGIVIGDVQFAAFDIFEYVQPAGLIQIVQKYDGVTDNSTRIIGGPASTLYSNFTSGIYTDGDTAVYRKLTPVPALDTTSSLVFNQISYSYIHDGAGSANIHPISDPAYYLPSVEVVPYTDDTYSSEVTDTIEFSLYNTNGLGSTGIFLDSDINPVTAFCLDIQSLTGANNITFDIIADSANPQANLFPNQVLINAASLNVGAIAVGNYLVHDEGSVVDGRPSRLTRINSVQGSVTNATNAAVPVGVTALLVTCQSEISVSTAGLVKSVELYFPIDTWIEYFNIFTFNGFNLLPTKHMPNGTNERQNQILNGTLNGTNLFKALTDTEVINFRYVVDTFGNGIESGSKSIYTRLCQSRKNAFAIVNAPSADDFKKSVDPSFKDITGALSTRFISTGGDLSKNPTVRYSLPSITQGASWGAFYFPYITVRDLGKNINVPPAGYISNNFIAKYENALPWSLVAGVRRGVVGGTGVVGLEINLDREDREYIEPFGLNPIVFQTGTGPTIFANKTAQQSPKSALSSINVREVVIYIQDGIDAILKNYLFEFNTAQTRLEIKTLADNFLASVQNDDGVYDFRNIMDESNNTPDVIDQNIGILDTYIEPVRGLEVLVQRTTILKTGAISSGNFQ